MAMANADMTVKESNKSTGPIIAMKLHSKDEEQWIPFIQGQGKTRDHRNHAGRTLERSVPLAQPRNRLFRQRVLAL